MKLLSIPMRSSDTLADRNLLNEKSYSQLFKYIAVNVFVMVS